MAPIRHEPGVNLCREAKETDTFAIDVWNLRRCANHELMRRVMSGRPPTMTDWIGAIGEIGGELSPAMTDGGKRQSRHRPAHGGIVMVEEGARLPCGDDQWQLVPRFGTIFCPGR